MNNKPTKKYYFGTIVATVWTNTTKEGKEFLSVSFDRRYKDTNGDWQSSNNFSLEESAKLIPLVSRVINDCGIKDLSQKTIVPKVENEIGEEDVSW